ncbi:MAG: recombinase family protein [Christensenellales bacterium]|jgi:hypothetical protein
MNTEQNRVIFGYTRNAIGQMKIKPLEMSVVNTIYYAYLEDNSLGKITDMLKEAKLLSPNGKEVWGKQIIDNLLSNEKYIGNGTYPPIVSQELFDEVQREKARRSNKGDKSSSGNRYSTAHPLSGLLVCGACGRKYRRYTRTNGDVVWRCANRVEHGSRICKHSPAIPEEYLKTVLSNELMQAGKLHNNDSFDDMIRILIDRVMIGTDGQIRIEFTQHTPLHSQSTIGQRLH